MKILITDIHHGNGGGHVTYILSLLQGLKDQFDLTLAAPASGRLYERARKIPGVRVIPGLYTSRPLTLLAEVWRLRHLLEHERYDVVHVNGGADHRHVMLARLGLRHRPAIVWTKHNTNHVGSVGHKMRARFGTDAAVAVCEYVQHQLAASHYQRSRIHLVRNGIPSEFITSITPAQRVQSRQDLFGCLPDNVLVFGSIGGTDLNKGWLVLLQAAASLPLAMRERVRVVVAGDLPHESILAQVRGVGLSDGQVVFPGLVTDVLGLMAACDIGFVLSYREAASYASCETMAMGLPTLVSDAGGLPENVRDGIDGWVVPAGDVQALATKLKAILATHPATLAGMGASARARVQAVFSTPLFLKHTEAVYRDALASLRLD